MDVPAVVDGGLVDVTLHAEAGEVAHHVAFFRLNDGITYDQLLATPEGQDVGMFTFRGGHGTLLPGHTAHLTLDLPAGTYAVRDLGEQNNADAQVVVTGQRSHDEPAAQGTIVLGPGMTIRVPDDFTPNGRWKFTNADTTQPHEASLVKLHAGTTVTDLIEWATTFDGPPPADFIGGFGALGPGLSGWLTFDEHLEPGNYALVCFLPNDAGMLHITAGMAAPIAVT